MSHPHTSVVPAGHDASAPPQDADSVPWLLDEFVQRVPGVTNALIGSKDGLTLRADGSTAKDRADTWAAAVSGLASLAAGMPGPDGRIGPAKQLVFERQTHLFLVMVAGQANPADLNPDMSSGWVDTLLLVVAEADADAGLIGFQMEKLIKSFGRYMVTPFRQELQPAVTDGVQASTR